MTLRHLKPFRDQSKTSRSCFKARGLLIIRCMSSTFVPTTDRFIEQQGRGRPHVHALRTVFNHWTLERKPSPPSSQGWPTFQTTTMPLFAGLSSALSRSSPLRSTSERITRMSVRSLGSNGLKHTLCVWPVRLDLIRSPACPWRPAHGDRVGKRNNFRKLTSEILVLPLSHIVVLLQHSLGLEGTTMMLLMSGVLVLPLSHIVVLSHHSLSLGLEGATMILLMSRILGFSDSRPLAVFSRILVFSDSQILVLLHSSLGFSDSAFTDSWILGFSTSSTVLSHSRPPAF
jgi:hypothetical protein